VTLDRTASFSGPASTLPGRRGAAHLCVLSLGRSPHNPWRAVKGALASAPSRAGFPGRRGPTDLGPWRPLLLQPTQLRPTAPHSLAQSRNQPRGPIPSVLQEEMV
jgi:hypothetical protein